MANPSKQPDHQTPGSTTLSLIEQLKDDQSQAWPRMYMLYEPLVRFWCQKAQLSKSDIPDLIQEVFQTVAKSIGKFSVQKNGSFRGWLRTITRSRIVDWYRKNADRPQAAGGSVAQSFFAGQPFDNPMQLLSDTESEEESQLTQQLYTRALSIIRDHFEEKTWTAFYRVVVDGQTPADVAKELGISPSTVRVAKSRVLNRLRKELGEIPE